MEQVSHLLLPLAVLSGVVFLTSDLPAQDVAPRDVKIVKNQNSPKARLAGVGLNSVLWTSGFWADRYEQCRKVTLRKLWELAADPDAGHVLDNMRIAGGLAEGEFAAGAARPLNAGVCSTRGRASRGAT